MRVLQVNKFYYPSGGADKYCLYLEKALKAAGHEVAVFAMADPKNEPSPWSDYFVSPIDFHSPRWSEKVRLPGRMIYSREARRKFARLLDDFRPDIIHCHNIYHQLSPAILPEATKRKIPVIMHAHDYKLICPNYKLFTQEKFCRECPSKNSYWPCIKNNCYGHFSRSALASWEMYLHHKRWHIYEKNLDLLIAPSGFMKDQLIAAGWPTAKVALIYNPAPKVSQRVPSSGEEKDYLLYFGRLSAEKGVADLIAAIKDTGANLHLAGSGPEEIKLKKLAAPEIKSGQIKFLGQLAGGELVKEIGAAKAVILPSRWPENMPLALLESLAKGKMIIAAAVGGLPEIIQDGVNGFLYPPGETEALKAKIKTVIGLPEETREKIKAQAFATAKELDSDDHLEAIMNKYLILVKKSD